MVGLAVERRVWTGVLVVLLAMASSGCARKGGKGRRPGSRSLRDAPLVISDPVARRYDAKFLQALMTLKSKAAGQLPAETPGRAEVTLDTWQGGKKALYKVTLDTTQQVMALSVPEDSVISRRGQDGEKFSPHLNSSLATAMGEGDFRAASMLAFKAKQFDDGLYAAVELAADRGAGRFPSRRKLLSDLATALKALKKARGKAQALGLVGAATDLGGHPVRVAPQAAKIATNLKQGFLASPLRSKPIGFYTWSRPLARIFQRDRLLQRKLKLHTARALARALGGSSDLRTRYQAALRLPERLTNGQAREDLSRAAAAFGVGRPPELQPGLSLFPPSRAHETDLIKKLYGRKPIPEGFNLADEMVRRIQAGTLKLKPRPDSGWYDHQTYALEPLVIPEKMPESGHLKLGDRYKKELVKLFKALLALTRETHIKQLEIPKAGSAAPRPGIVLKMYPRLSQEPLATFYLRRALAYRFVRKVLIQAFGAPGLQALKRLTAAGPTNLTLDRELQLMEGLFYGAYLSTAYELGMTPQRHADLGPGLKKSLALYRRWNPRKDPDVSRDVRMMVPVFYDLKRQKIKVWAVLGVTSRPLSVHYSKPPEVTAVDDAQGNPVALSQVRVTFPATKFTVAYPVMAEVYVTRLLDRKEFRKLCDRHQTQQAILKHLK
jgi:hypothetical protein